MKSIKTQKKQKSDLLNKEKGEKQLPKENEFPENVNQKDFKLSKKDVRS